MRVAVLGLGSMGRRHATILRELGNQVTGYDIRPGSTPLDGIEIARSETEALEDAQAVVVASPPSEHLSQARTALARNLHVLVEKPFAPSVEGVGELAELARERGLVLWSAMNLRFHPGVSTVHRLVTRGAIGRPLRASVWCGSWLPGWRAGTDYRESYSARRELGGGVLLDAIHELDYAIWVLGRVERVRGLLAHKSSLEIDVEDVCSLVLEHAGGAVTSLTLDYLDRSYHRGCRIVGDAGTLHWSWEQQEVVVCPSGGAPKRLAAVSDVAPTYRAQLEAFIRATRSPRTREVCACGAEEAAAALRVADGARIASAGGLATAIETPDLALRPASQADAADLLRWRNDPMTRRASVNTGMIEPDEHERWLHQLLADPDRSLFIAVLGKTPVGQVRLDRLANGSVELHIGLAPEARGRDLAAPLIGLAVHGQARALGASRVLARVKADNEPSRRSFLKAGFRTDGDSLESWWLELD